MKADRADQLVCDLRKFATFIEEWWHDLPNDLEISPKSWLWTWQVDDVPEVLRLAVRAALKSGAVIEKDPSDNYFTAALKFGELEYEIICKRDEVCTAKVVGTETVTRRVPPDGEWTEQEVEQDVVEWECHPLLAPAKEVTA